MSVYLIVKHVTAVALLEWCLPLGPKRSVAVFAETGIQLKMADMMDMIFLTLNTFIF